MFKIDITHLNFITDLLKHRIDVNEINDRIFKLSGIVDFFENERDYKRVCNQITSPHDRQQENIRRDYGDFQTPEILTEQVCSLLSSVKVNPALIVEPACGNGSFILSSLKHFRNIEHIFGVEIYDEYIWNTKFRILEYFIKNPAKQKPSIHLVNSNIFHFDIDSITKYINNSILVIGNPPWITNAELGSLNSFNRPQKSNFKNHKGIEAITGRGNFDIAEYISLLMIKHFDKYSGHIAFLLKNSVIRNLVHDLSSNHYRISGLKSYTIDTKKYFDAAAGASLFTASFQKKTPDVVCKTYTLDHPHHEISRFGWMNDKFISNMTHYKKIAKYDGISPFEWRQGVKHDNAKVFELIKKHDKYYNGFQEEIDIEDDLVFGLIKSSDLKKTIIRENRKFVIITQTYIGQDTSFIVTKFPKLFHYLKSKETLINNRKSSIYKNKPLFSIFGIGVYSFKPFKIAISGLYHEPVFSLLLPVHNKPLMIDDTCYMLGFDRLSDALFTLAILKDTRTQQLLRSIAFKDAKRPYTKDVLMRIAIDNIARELDYNYILNKISDFNSQVSGEISFSEWERYKEAFAM